MAFLSMACQILWEKELAIVKWRFGCSVTQGTQKEQRKSQWLTSFPRKAVLCALSKLVSSGEMLFESE